MNRKEYIQLFQDALVGDQTSAEQVSNGLDYFVRTLFLTLMSSSNDRDLALGKQVGALHDQCSDLPEGEVVDTRDSMAVARLVACGVHGLVEQNSGDSELMGTIRNLVVLDDDDTAVHQRLRAYGVSIQGSQITPILLKHREQVSVLVGWLSGDEKKEQ